MREINGRGIAERERENSERRKRPRVCMRDRERVGDCRELLALSRLVLTHREQEALRMCVCMCMYERGKTRG